MAISVSAVQFKRPATGDGLSSLVLLAEEAAKKSSLVVLPEMAATATCFKGGKLRAWPKSRAVLPFWLARRCKTAPIVDCCWIRRTVRRSLSIQPTSSIPRVSWPLITEKRCCTPQMSFGRPRRYGLCGGGYDFGRLGVGICMDLNDDRFISWVNSARINVLAFPTNWLQEDIDVLPGRGAWDG